MAPDFRRLLRRLQVPGRILRLCHTPDIRATSSLFHQRRRCSGHRRGRHFLGPFSSGAHRKRYCGRGRTCHRPPRHRSDGPAAPRPSRNPMIGRVIAAQSIAMIRRPIFSAPRAMTLRLRSQSLSSSRHSERGYAYLMAPFHGDNADYHFAGRHAEIWSPRGAANAKRT